MANTQGTDIQKQTDLEQAKAKLAEVAETKEARKDPRAGENALISRRPGMPEGRVPDSEREIREGHTPPKKKSFGKKLKEAFFPETAGDEKVSEYIFFRIVVPSIKRLTYEGLNTALCMILGMDPKTNRIIGNNSNPHTANASLYRNRQGTGYSSRKPILADYEWDEETAKDYFNQMLEVIDKYGDLSVSNVYSICGLQTLIRTTDRNWGWTRATFARANVYPLDQYGERWIIDLPEAVSLR